MESVVVDNNSVFAFENKRDDSQSLQTTFLIDQKLFLIRPLLPSDNLQEYRNLFLSCDNVLCKGQAEDDQRLVNIGRDYVHHAFETDLKSYENLSGIFFRGKGQFWILIDVSKEIIIGSIALEDKSSRVGELRRMCVSSHYRRLGLGSRLVQHLLAYAFSHDFSRVFLSTPSSNSSAISMYTKAQFVFEKAISVTCGADGDLEISTFAILNDNDYSS
jgi:ribosomal protein S18 acetylase RimI-like enzyme